MTMCGLIGGPAASAQGQAGRHRPKRDCRAAAYLNPQIKRYYQRKCARSNGVVAIKTVAHKLARACYYILRD